jgi:hypothetical protein
VLLPPPAQGTLYTVAGGDESAEFLRHNTRIQEAWGEERVPVCEPSRAATTSACWMRWWSRAPAEQLANELVFCDP